MQDEKNYQLQHTVHIMHESQENGPAFKNPYYPYFSQENGPAFKHNEYDKKKKLTR